MKPAFSFPTMKNWNRSEFLKSHINKKNKTPKKIYDRKLNTFLTLLLENKLLVSRINTNF